MLQEPQVPRKAPPSSRQHSLDHLPAVPSPLDTVCTNKSIISLIFESSNLVPELAQSSCKPLSAVGIHICNNDHVRFTWALHWFSKAFLWITVPPHCCHSRASCLNNELPGFAMLCATVLSAVKHRSPSTLRFPCQLLVIKQYMTVLFAINFSSFLCVKGWET